MEATSPGVAYECLCALIVVGVIFNCGILLLHFLRFSRKLPFSVKWTHICISCLNILLCISLGVLVLNQFSPSPASCKAGGYLLLFSIMILPWMIATVAGMLFLWQWQRMDEKKHRDYLSVFVLILSAECFILAIIAFLPLTTSEYFDTVTVFRISCIPLRVAGEQSWAFSVLLLVLMWIPSIACHPICILTHWQLCKLKLTTDSPKHNCEIRQKMLQARRILISIQIHGLLWMVFSLVLSVAYFAQIDDSGMRLFLLYMAAITTILHPILMVLLGNHNIHNKCLGVRGEPDYEYISHSVPDKLEHVQKLPSSIQEPDVVRFLVQWGDFHGNQQQGLMKLYQPRFKQKWSSEVKAMTKLSKVVHPNIAGYMWASRVNEFTSTISSLGHHSVVKNSRLTCRNFYQHGSLRTFLTSKIGELTELGIHYIALDIANGLAHLQELHLLHNNLTTKSIYVNGNIETMVLNVVIGDFEESLEVDTPSTRKNAKDNVSVFTVLEQMPSSSLNLFASDIRSFSLLLIEMLASLAKYRLSVAMANSMQHSTKAAEKPDRKVLNIDKDENENCETDNINDIDMLPQSLVVSESEMNSKLTVRVFGNEAIPLKIISGISGVETNTSKQTSRVLEKSIKPTKQTSDILGLVKDEMNPAVQPSVSAMTHEEQGGAGVFKPVRLPSLGSRKALSAWDDRMRITTTDNLQQQSTGQEGLLNKGDTDPLHPKKGPRMTLLHGCIASVAEEDYAPESGDEEVMEICSRSDSRSLDTSRSLDNSRSGSEEVNSRKNKHDTKLPCGKQNVLMETSDCNATHTDFDASVFQDKSLFSDTNNTTILNGTPQEEGASNSSILPVEMNTSHQTNVKTQYRLCYDINASIYPDSASKSMTSALGSGETPLFKAVNHTLLPSINNSGLSKVFESKENFSEGHNESSQLKYDNLKPSLRNEKSLSSDNRECMYVNSGVRGASQDQSSIHCYDKVSNETAQNEQSNFGSKVVDSSYDMDSTTGDQYDLIEITQDGKRTSVPPPGEKTTNQKWKRFSAASANSVTSQDSGFDTNQYGYLTDSGIIQFSPGTNTTPVKPDRCRSGDINHPPAKTGPEQVRQTSNARKILRKNQSGRHQDSELSMLSLSSVDSGLPQSPFVSSDDTDAYSHVDYQITNKRGLANFTPLEKIESMSESDLYENISVMDMVSSKKEVNETPNSTSQIIETNSLHQGLCSTESANEGEGHYEKLSGNGQSPVEGNVSAMNNETRENKKLNRNKSREVKILMPEKSPKESFYETCSSAPESDFESDIELQLAMIFPENNKYHKDLLIPKMVPHPRRRGENIPNIDGEVSPHLKQSPLPAEFLKMQLLPEPVCSVFSSSAIPSVGNLKQHPRVLGGRRSRNPSPIPVNAEPDIAQENHDNLDECNATKTSPTRKEFVNDLPKNLPIYEPPDFGKVILEEKDLLGGKGGKSSTTRVCSECRLDNAFDTKGAKIAPQVCNHIQVNLESIDTGSLNSLIIDSDLIIDKIMYHPDSSSIATEATVSTLGSVAETVIAAPTVPKQANITPNPPVVVRSVKLEHQSGVGVKQQEYCRQLSHMYLFINHETMMTGSRERMAAMLESMKNQGKLGCVANQMLQLAKVCWLEEPAPTADAILVLLRQSLHNAQI